jgi:hypothetical protein
MSKQDEQGVPQDQNQQMPIAAPPGGWARRAAARAAERGNYMAGLLTAYQEMQGMDERQLAADLGCSDERLLLLGLCRAPRRAQFAADVREVAAFAGADPGRLAQMIRAVEAKRALAQRRGVAGEGYLAAARDADDGSARLGDRDDEQGAATSDPTAETTTGEAGPDGSPA